MFLCCSLHLCGYFLSLFSFFFLLSLLVHYFEFYLHYPSSRIMAFGSTQPVTEMSLPGSKERPARKDDNLTAISEPNV
jgi:hypothetical protein